SPWGPARGRPWACTAPPRPTPSPTGATTWCPTTSRTWPCRCWPTACCCATPPAPAPTAPTGWLPPSPGGRGCRCEARRFAKRKQSASRPLSRRDAMPPNAAPARPPAAPSWRQRHRLLPTPGGRTWLLIAAAMVGIGLIKGINLLLLLGYALFLAALLNAFLAARQGRALAGRRRILGPLFAGAECPVAVEVSNPGGRRRSGLELEDRGPGQDLRWPVAALAGGATYRLRGLAVPLRRGRHRWGGLWVGSSYPFGLIRRACLLAGPEDVLVL